MKLAVMKLTCLLVFAVGVVILAFAWGIPSLGALATAAWTAFMNLGEIQQTLVGGAVGCVIALLGLYGVLPRLPSKAKNRTVSYRGNHGNSIIELDAAQAKLTQVLGSMPEIRKIHIQMRADEEDNKVIIEGSAVLRNEPGTSARVTCDRVNNYIREAATNLLGLEVQAPITLRVKDFDVDAKVAGKKLRERCDGAVPNTVPGGAGIRMESRTGEADGPEPAYEPFRSGNQTDIVSGLLPAAEPVVEEVTPLSLAKDEDLKTDAASPVEGRNAESTAFSMLDKPGASPDNEPDSWTVRP